MAVFLPPVTRCLSSLIPSLEAILNRTLLALDVDSTEMRLLESLIDFLSVDHLIFEGLDCPSGFFLELPQLSNPSKMNSIPDEFFPKTFPDSQS